MRQTSTCPTCQGTGETFEKSCSKCHGHGTVKVDRDIKVQIPAGIDNGATIRLSGRGGAHRKGPKGDLYVHVRVKPHSRLKRLGQDISSTITIPMVDAALGAEVPVETVDGDVKLKVPAGTQNNKVFKLSDRGVPGISGRKRGDHLVTVLVEVPKNLTDEQKRLLQEFANSSGKKRRFW
jgi:molecular chaperone DnaJ